MNQELKTKVKDSMRLWYETCVFVDGHGFYRAEMYKDAGVPSELVDDLVRNHKSKPIGYDNPIGKETIFGSDGQVMDETYAVYHNDFLAAICVALGLDATSNAWGRGFRSKELYNRIRKFKEGLENELV